MTVRPLRARCLLLILMCACALRVGAQATKAAGIGPGPYTAVGFTGSLYKSDYGKLNLLGPTVFVDANIHRLVGLEAEARWLRWNGKTGVTQDTYMVGPRYSFKPVGWVPYVKMPVGMAHMRFPYGYATGNYFVMAPGGGVDWWLPGDTVRVRVVDFEYQIWPQFSFGTLKPYGVSAGISIRVW